MASSTSPEANEIRRRGRQRLIGAVAIAVALVVFVPMILDSEPRPARNEPVLEIPAKENAPPLPPPAPSSPPAKAAPAPSSEPKPAPAPPKATAPAPPKATAPAPAKAAAPAKSAPPPESAATPKLEGFAVQVGAFKDDEKLKQAREKLAAAGIAHYIERRDSATGALTRLRAGPFATRAAAQKALAALKAAALDGQVVPLP